MHCLVLYSCNGSLNLSYGRHNVVWCVVVLYGAVWCGVVWCDVVWETGHGAPVSGIIFWKFLAPNSKSAGLILSYWLDLQSGAAQSKAARHFFRKHFPTWPKLNLEEHFEYFSKNLGPIWLEVKLFNVYDVLAILRRLQANLQGVFGETVVQADQIWFALSF